MMNPRMTERKDKENTMAVPENVKKHKTTIKAALLAVTVILVAIAVIIGFTIAKPSDKKTPVQNVPDNPRQSATVWLTELMGKTSKKFGTDMFNENNKQFKQLMGGDVSFIPEDIRGSVHIGEKSDDMKIPRELLTGSAYAGLIMYSTAYKKTKDAKATVPGYTMSSYDAETATVYIPAMAIMLTNQPIEFAVHWDGSGWKLQGDPIAWDVYAMLENIAYEGNSSGSQQEGKQ